ncbi:MAG: DNA-binding response regulator [Acidobacteriaceae bacterium]|nr:DNA-binding response regulator [Acidobacteriaceae bacterium]
MLIARSRPEWEICGEAANGNEALEAIKSLKPDVVVLDITMPGMSGLEVAAKVATLDVGSRVLMFTMHESEMLPSEVLKAGAQGYVLKSQATRDLIRAIDTLLAGDTFFGPESVSEPGSGTRSSQGAPTLRSASEASGCRSSSRGRASLIEGERVFGKTSSGRELSGNFGVYEVRGLRR